MKDFFLFSFSVFLLLLNLLLLSFSYFMFANLLHRNRSMAPLPPKPTPPRTVATRSMTRASDWIGATPPPLKKFRTSKTFEERLQLIDSEMVLEVGGVRHIELFVSEDKSTPKPRTNYAMLDKTLKNCFKCSRYHIITDSHKTIERSYCEECYHRHQAYHHVETGEEESSEGEEVDLYCEECYHQHQAYLHVETGEEESSEEEEVDLADHGEKMEQVPEPPQQLGLEVLNPGYYQDIVFRDCPECVIYHYAEFTGNKTFNETVYRHTQEPCTLYMHDCKPCYDRHYKEHVTIVVQKEKEKEKEL